MAPTCRGVGNESRKEEDGILYVFCWRNWGEVGREKFPKCVEVGIRCWFPSTFYMVFHEDDDQCARRQAVNMLGKFVDAWWVWRDGTWELEEIK